MNEPGGESTTPNPTTEASDVATQRTHFSRFPIPFVVRLPDRPYVFGTWEALGADGTASHFPRDRQAAYDRTARAAARARERGWEAQRLLGRLQVMRHAVALEPGVRATLLTDSNQLRLLVASNASSARQQLTLMARDFGSPDATQVEAFLHGEPQAPGGAGTSGAVAFCKAQGLPLTDWRVEQAQ